MNAQRRTHVAVALFFVLASVVMTWPLARILDRGVSDPGDPFINIWILDWGQYASFNRPLSLFHANAWYPARYSLAFSENLYGITLLLIPVRLAGASPVTAYNLAMLAGFALSGFGAYVLGWRLTRSVPAAVAAGTFFAFVLPHFSHLQHVWRGWLPLMLAALLWYAEGPGWRRAMLFGGAFLMNGLTNIHWLLFGSVAMAPSALVVAAGGLRRWKELAVCTAAAVVLLVPFLYPYAAAAELYGLARTAEETRHYSATPADWLASSAQQRLYGFLRDASVDAERWLFPGAVSIVLTAAGLLLFRGQPRAVVLGLIWIAIGFAGSLGLNFVFHQLLFDVVPGFRAIRVPARWAVVAHLGMAILIAVATAAVARRRPWIGWTMCALFLLELSAMPIRWYVAVTEVPPVYSWLARSDARAVLELPMNHAMSEPRYLLYATEHHKPMVMAGPAPPLSARLTAMSKQNPIPDAFVEELRRIGVDLIIVHADMLGEYGEATRAWLRREIDRSRMRFVARFHYGIAGDWVFSLRPGPDLRSRDLQTFLAGGWTLNEDAFGLMQPPPPHIRGAATFSGFAFSPYGIRSVDLLFGNGAVRLPARLVEHAGFSRDMPWYAATPRPWFVADFRSRPRGVRRETDVQVEITDGRGRKVRLNNYWMTWE